MGAREKTYKTAEKYIATVNAEAKEIELLESLLAEKHKKVEKTLAKLRAYKKRGIVQQLSKYNYEIKKGE